MTIDQAQKDLDKIIKMSSVGYWEPLSNLLRLVEEVGELSREINIKYGNKIRKEEEKNGDMALEMGDILFSLICIANSQNINLNNELLRSIEKYMKRKKQAES